LVARAAFAAEPGRPPSVVVADDELRLRRSDVALALTAGRRVGESGGEMVLAALRGETVAFQVAVLAGDRPIGAMTLALAGPDGPREPRATVFRQHYVAVDRRSRNDVEPAESLGWHAGAGAPDDEVRGEVPDALLPVALDPTPVAAAPAVPAGQLGAFWVDVAVPDDAAPGPHRATAVVTADGAPLARFDLRVDVAAPRLPYRATSVFIYYEAERLAARMGGQNAAAIERQLWQLLHAHHVDALPTLRTGADVDRLRAAYDGSLFTAAAGYDGPGAGTPPAVVALGAYGALGPPGPASLALVDEMLAHLPPPAREPFLYAIDESCGSPRAGAWKSALGARAAGAVVRVGQTCDDPPARQPVDVALVSAGSFERAMPADARAAGRRAWIYNGVLPHTGTLLLDADPRGLTANGWIAATSAIERWFYWESIFWDDDNRGGHGAIDPFATAESFHNAAGDSCLGDGVLLYPGRQQGAFAARSLGYEGLLPSIRLAAVRRGIEDAGLIALAARAHPAETSELVARTIPAVLDEAPPDRRASWETAGPRFAPARAALRALIGPHDAALAPAEIRALFEDLAARRQQAIPTAPRPARGSRRRTVGGVVVRVALAAALVLVGMRFRRRRHA
jgi:hypothetical protein